MVNELQAWLARDPDPDTRAELERLVELNDKVEIARRFNGRLQFGTAGLRGVVGAGPARMNRLVVRETTAGLGQYLLATNADAAARGVIVAYDGRLDSRQFARDAASVFAALGFKVYITTDVAPTPVGAYGVVSLGTAAGVVVTASHNPPEYNGYKVYWENGAQIIPPHDAGIAAAIVTAAKEDIPYKEFDDAVREGQITILGESFTEEYCNAITSSYLFGNSINTSAVSVAYTAMHGVGANIAQSLLQHAGVDKFFSVAAQREPDGNFPTVNFPNPEEPGAMDAVLALAQKNGASLACANDPDADRLAVAARDNNGDYRMLSGDQLGVLLGHYVLQKTHEFTPIVCTTIVSSSMLKAVAKASGAVFFETLTGFKWLANVAMDNENSDHKFLFAYEEALGYAVGRQVRDKDGLSALLAFVQMTAQLAAEGKTVLDQLEFLYRRYGLHSTQQRSIATQPGSSSIGAALRASQPSAIAGIAIEAIEDLQSGQRHFADGRVEDLELSSSDVLIYRLVGGGRVIVRPSGTEPKVKCYYEVVEQVTPEEAFSDAEQRAQAALSTLVEQHQDSLDLLMALQ
ncbi:MAG: phospho-sugar mutase [Pseudomonadales bacterium]